MSHSLTHNAETHFEFGKNWAQYSESITEDDIDIAQKSLSTFLGTDSLSGKTFLDIGCGSGIHALAALRLGANAVRAVDIDQDSVATAKAVISSRWNESNFSVEQANIFEMPAENFGQFDVVYSWGVLHHTGDMWAAIKKASAFAAPGGIFAIAIYRKTRYCGFWRWEKERYARSGNLYRVPVVATYITVRTLRDLARFRNPLRKAREHKRNRGMKRYTDVIDWVGGYPYESASAEDIVAFVEPLGFDLEYSDKTKQKKSVILGSGNAEYRFRKKL